MKKLSFLLIVSMGMVFVLLGSAPMKVLAEEGVYIETQERTQNQEVIGEDERVCFEHYPLRIASFATNPPFGWVEKAGFRGINDRLLYLGKGFNIDFIKKIGKELKIAIEDVSYPSDEQTMNAFHDGTIDIIVGSYYDPKMKLAGHAYVVPALIQNVITVVFMKGKEKDVKRFEDLLDMKGVVRSDEQFYQYVRLQMPKEVDIEVVNDSKIAFTKLVKGEADYMLTSPYSAEAEARRFKLNTDISMIPVPLLGQELFLLVSKDVACPHLVHEIALALREKRKDMNGMKRELINYIDTWGQRFKNDPGLIDQLKKEMTVTEEEQSDIIRPLEENQKSDNPLANSMDME